MYSSPTVVDIDSDGKLEIIVGTGVGFIHLLDHQGRNFPKFLSMFREIFSPCISINDGFAVCPSGGGRFKW
jgi:hypothetical protein